MDDTTKLAYSKAQERAKAMGGADKVTALGGNRYSVLSSKGDDFYTVTVVQLAHQHIYVCTCVAGQNSRCCWHKGATLLYRTREAMRAAVAPAGTSARAVSTTARDSIWGAGSTL